MIDLRTYLDSHCGTREWLIGASRTPRYPVARGREVARIGLVDAAIEVNVDDLASASLHIRGFAQRAATAPALNDHGTCSATLLVGQGVRHLRGLAPQAGLHVATVSEDSGVASPARVAEAIEWLTDTGVQTIAIPMGDREDHPDLAAAVARAAQRGVIVLAAHGGEAGEPPWFPARHPAVHAIAAPAAMTIPVVGADGRLSFRSGSSIACVLAAGMVALGILDLGACAPGQLRSSELDGLIRECIARDKRSRRQRHARLHHDF